jgi:hypothetical protein
LITLKYKIDSKILSETTECKSNFSCLAGKKECFCDIEESNIHDAGIIFIRPVKNISCTYVMSFGYSWLCTCPIRKAIYNKYGI